MKMMTKETVVLISVLTLRNFDSMLLVSVGKKKSLDITEVML